MRWIFWLLLVSSSWAEAPWIVGHTLRLPPAVQGALTRYDTTFKPWKVIDYLPEIQAHYKVSKHQLPFAAVGDYNGDGRPDLVVDGHTRTATVQLLLLSPAYRVIVRETGPPKDPRKITYEVGAGKSQTGLWVYLEYTPPTTMRDNSARTVQLKTDAFTVVYYLKSSITYYYAQGKWQEWNWD